MAIIKKQLLNFYYMARTELSLKDKIGNKTVEELLNQDRKNYFKYMSEGYDFDDKVRKAYRFNKTVRDDKIEHIFLINIRC